MSYTNLEKHRRAVVDLACDVLCTAVDLPEEFNATGVDLFADFEGEPLASTSKPNADRSVILDVADCCDGIYLYATRHDETKDYTAFILILWGNGAGACVSDYSANLDSVDAGATGTHVQALLDHTEFLEI